MSAEQDPTFGAGWAAKEISQRSSFQSFRELWMAIKRSRRIFLSIVGFSLASCLLYCLLAPNVYEATARVALPGAQTSLLTLDRNEGAPSGSFASGQVQLETLANVLRSDQIAWDVIARLRLYKAPGFSGSFAERHSDFNPTQAGPEEREWLLERFERDLTVQTIPRTLVLEVRFRSRDAALSAAVVNAVLDAYHERESEARIEATHDAAKSLDSQLRELKSRIDHDDQALAAFQKQHGILNSPATLGNGQPTEVEHTADLGEVDALGRELVSAMADRIALEAEYRSAVSGDAELVVASDPKLIASSNSLSALLQRLRTRRSELEQEEAQLRIEHGPNFPRVLEIRGEIEDLDQQIKAQDEKLVERLKGAWEAASNREQMVRKSLGDATSTGMTLNEAALKYAAMRQQTNANRELYIRLSQQEEEASLAASSRGSQIFVIDHARQPAKAVSPNLLVLLAITLFVSLWAGLAVALWRDYSRPGGMQVAAVFALAAAMASGHAQAPTPSTSGLPTGVARIPQSTEVKSTPSAKDAPAVWSGPQGKYLGVLQGASGQQGTVMAAPIGPGDLLEVSEAHTPEMRASVRVSESGMVTLALAGDVQVRGMNETSAAHAIESALIERGMLIHPQVTVLVTVYAGQDISVLGEVARPGIYNYTVHHRLLDLLSMASGLTQSAGRLVTIEHRDTPKSVELVALDPAGSDTTSDHNPELLPGDTVQVSRAGLVYVVGDVVRPGGFPVDPVQPTTVVQALSLAWGPGQNAALTKAILIREQAGNRTITTLNLKRMLRGIDPDIPIHDRDIVFVPDSMAKNLWNRTMESVIQSAAGVSIYSGLVYSQRF